jgi:hypothetical protein
MHSNKVSPAARAAAGFAIGAALAAAGAITQASAAQSQDVWFSMHSTAAPPAAATAPPVSAPTGALVTYPALTDFLAATNGLDLAFEDFEGGFAPPNGMRVCFQAVASTSDDPCFAPGQLVPGFGIRSSGGNIWDPVTGVDSDLVVLGAGTRGIGSTVVGADVPDPPENPTQIAFDNNPTAIAMDVYDGLLGQPVQIEAYDANDQLIGIFTVMPASASLPAFAGFTSPVPVRRVAVNALSSGGGELIDNLYFGGGAGHLEAAPAQADFDAVALGGTKTLPITLSNDGALDLQLGAIPAPPSPFSIATDACSGSSLAPGADCTIEFAFAPTFASEYSTALDIPAGGVASTHLNLIGQGVRARVSPMPGAIDFGTVDVGGAPGSAELTLANLTGAPLSVTTIAAVSAPFAQSGGSCAAPPFDLAPGDECTLQLSFAPMSIGETDAALTITGSGLPAATTVNLHGTGG